jgi:signal transduction histidine kinase
LFSGKALCRLKRTIAYLPAQFMIQRTTQPAQARADEQPLEILLPRSIAGDTKQLIRTRWAVGLLLILATVLSVRVFRLPLPELRLYAVGAATLGYNAVLVLLDRRARRLDGEAGLRCTYRLLELQVILDWVAMAIFLHLTGGIVSPAIPFLLFHILIVTILLPALSPYLFVATGTTILALIAVLEWDGLIPHFTAIPALPADLHRSPLVMLAQISFFTATAVGLVYLTGSIMQRLRERERHLAALIDTSQAVSSTLDLSKVLDTLAREAARALSASRASIRLLDETGDRLEMVAAVGLSEVYLQKGSVEVSRSALDGEALAGYRVIVADTRTDPRLQYPKEVAQENIRSMLVVPIAGSKTLGVLRVYSGTANRFDEEDTILVSAVAHQGAIAIENALAHQALKKADEVRAQFVRVITHELRAPVAGAQSLIRTMTRGLAGELTEPQQDIINRLEGRFDGLMVLINDLLALAASQTVEMEEPLTQVDLRAILARIVEEVAERAAEKGLDFTVNLPGQPLMTCATEKGLTRIFGNLVDNAIKYTPVGGVRLDVTSQADRMTVEVVDTGIGIPSDQLGRIWEEFFRARTAKESGIVGTGLGLGIVRQQVERFGGTISVRSEEGEGSTFSVCLPLTCD